MIGIRRIINAVARRLVRYSDIPETISREPPPRLITMQDNYRLSDRDYERACQICNHVRTLYQRVEDRSAPSGSSEDVARPANMWGDGFMKTNFSTITKDDRSILDHFRLFTYNFSGWRLLENKPAEAMPLLQAVMEDLETQLQTVYTDDHFLLEEHKRLLQNTEENWRFSLPPVLGEVGWLVDGIIINGDTVHHQKSVNALYEAGILQFVQMQTSIADRHFRMLEIGAGFGAIASFFMNKFRNLTCYIIDIPESLAFSYIYLSMTRPDLDVRLIDQPGKWAETDGVDLVLIPAHLAGDFQASGISLDLAVNILSLTEMSEKQVHFYGALLAEMLGPEGRFFEHNHYAKVASHVNSARILAEYFPYCTEILSERLVLDHNADISVWSQTLLHDVISRGFPRRIRD